MGIVNASVMFPKALKANFLETYSPMVKDSDPLLNMVMDRSLESDGAAEDYPYFLSPPHPSRVDKGDSVEHKAFGSRRFRVVNKKWRLAIDWHHDDEQDDQLKGLVKQARAAGEHFALLDERVFFQVLTGATDNDLLEAVPNAGDGSALFATTAGGSNRFGASNGNLLSGVTLTTAADIRSAVWNAVEQMQILDDTEGQPLYRSDYVLRHGIAIIHNVQNLELYEEAFGQRVTAEFNSSGNAGAAVQNTIHSSGIKITRWATQRITDSSVYVFIANPNIKAIFKQTREPLRDNLADFANSDRVREDEIKSLYWSERAGYGVCGEPYQCVKTTT